MGYTPKDWKDFPDTSTPITAAALEDLETRVVEYGNTYVTALPGSPVDGQEIYYAADATGGVIWHLRYRSASSSSYKWEFVGGPPLYAAAGEISATTTGAWTVFSDNSPSISIPLTGDYVIEFGAYAKCASSDQRTYLAATATGLSESDDASTGQPAGDNGAVGSLSRTVTATGISGTLKLKYYVSAGWTYYARWVKLSPIRV